MCKWNADHTKRIENQAEEVMRMEIKIENQKKEMKRFKAESEGRLKAISLSYYNKFRALTDKRDQEKDVIESEMEITKKIRELANIKEVQLFGELSDVKSMLMVPRLHMKHVEKKDWASIKELHGEYLKQ